MSSNQPQQTEIPAPEPPMHTCSSCGRALCPPWDGPVKVGKTTWLCRECSRDPRRYWMRVHGEG